MKTDIPEEMRKFHKQMAISLFNGTWDLLDNPDRTKDEEAEMIHMAHASCYHWSVIGTPLEIERGEWQISRVYSTLKLPESALFHADKCLTICRENDYGDFDLAFAYEGLARGYWLKNETANFQKYYQLAERAGKEIKEKDDQDYFFSELKSIQ